MSLGSKKLVGNLHMKFHYESNTLVFTGVVEKTTPYDRVVRKVRTLTISFSAHRSSLGLYSTHPLKRSRDAAAALAEQAALESGTVQAALEARTQTATAVVVQLNVAAAPGPDIKPSPAAVAAAQAAAAKSAAVMQWDDDDEAL